MKQRPLLLDLFCCQGGAAVGYHRAGFDVVGVDCVSQPRYPFPLIVDDAMDVLRQLIAGWSIGPSMPDGERYWLRNFAVIHASPPCQRHSVARNIGSQKEHPDLIPETRRLLAASGKLYVVENVLGAPLQNAVMVCGLALRLGVKRHRFFESNLMLFGTDCPTGHRGDYISVFGHSVGERVGGKGWVTVYGGGAPAAADTRRRASAELARKAMGISWMTRDGLSQAIPPAYTKYVGSQLLAALERI